MGKLALANDQNQSRGLQLFYVMGKSSCSHRLTLAYIGAGNATGLSPDLLQDLMAPGIGQGFGDQSYLPR